MRNLSRLGLLIAVAIASFFVWAERASAAGRPIVTTDVLRLRSVTSIDVAPDGSKAIFAVRSIAAVPPGDDAAEAEAGYAYRSHLYLLDLTDLRAKPRQLTYGERHDRSPRLSGDGREVAFVRGTDEPQGEAQVWVIRLEGGEARQVTHLEHGADAPQWSPRGRRLLVSSSIPAGDLEGTPSWPTERPRRDYGDAAGDGLTPRPAGTREQVWAWLARNAEKLNPLVITRLDFQDEEHLRGTMRFAHLFVVDLDDQAPPARITAGFFDHVDAAFMPDGASVVYAAKKAADRHPDRIRRTDLWRVNVDGSDDRLLLALEDFTLRSPRPSRDGATIAFVGRRLDEPAYRATQLGVASLGASGASEPLWLTDEASFDASVEDYRWQSTRTALVFTSAIGGGFPLLTVSPGLLEPATLVDGGEGPPVGVHAFGVGGGAIVYTTTSPDRPCVLRVRDGRGDRLVYDLNPWVADKTLSMPTEGWISRPDGTRVQYWLMEPTNRERRKTYPLLLEIHGGPGVMWGPGEWTMWHEFQLLCSWGYGVVYANPRGSDGYGYRFLKANFQDWGEGPAGDVLAVVDQVVLETWADGDRLVVTGGSYAGYLTAWIVSHDHRFKAAVAQRGVYDLATFFGEGNAWRLVEWTMGGQPYDARYREVIDRNSPFTYVNRIRTPLLIMHASRDLRAGVAQSQMLYRALKAQNRPVEYVRYPEAGHDLSRTGDPVQRMDRLNRMIEFFERYVDNSRPAPVDANRSFP